MMIDTAAAPRSGKATWYVNYNGDNKDGLTAILDANTGAGEKVLKN